MRSHHYDALHLFVAIARHRSLSAAAAELHLTKGALSHQIKRLEKELGFELFVRHSSGITLSEKGRALITIAEQSFRQIDSAVEQIAKNSEQSLTIGVTTYFASRWLSPRLTSFMQSHPDIRLRIQPMIDLSNFAGEEVDLAIRWGTGNWDDWEIVPLMRYPAWPSGNKVAFDLVEEQGIEFALSRFTFLHDRENSNAWSEWFERAGFTIEQRMDALIIPDPNVRVQAVLDGQGIALNDELVSDELHRGKLFRLSQVELSDYGYHLAYEKHALKNRAVVDFIDWIVKEGMS